MMTTIAGRHRRIGRTALRWALAAGLPLAVAACQVTLDGAEAPYVLTVTGDYVRSSAPPGVEVLLGSKQVRPADTPTGRGPNP